MGTGVVKNRVEELECLMKKEGKKGRIVSLNIKRKKRKDCKIDEVNSNNTRKELAHLRSAWGLTKNGFVKQYTPVFLHSIPQIVFEHRFENHAFFHAMPHTCVGQFPEGLLVELKAFESVINTLLETRSSVLEGHKYGANVGVNLGNSVVSGGVHSCKDSGISGSIHLAKLLKRRDDLRKESIHLFSKLLHHAFGNKAWFQRMTLLCKRLNEDSNEERTIPGTPVSGIWFTKHPREEKIHCDGNVVGATFVLTTFEGNGATLCMSSPNQTLKKCKLSPGTILAGKWANWAHCNTKINAVTAENRTSWTLYLDGRAFFRSYKYVTPKGYV